MKDVAGTYNSDELDNIATAGDNEDINWNDENALASASPELQQFVERLGDCVTGDAGSPDTTETSDPTEESETTTDGPETTEGSAATTEAGDTTDAVEPTEASAAVETTGG